MKDSNSNLAGLVVSLLGMILIVALRCGWIKWDQTDKYKRASNQYINNSYSPTIPEGGYQVPQTGFTGYHGPQGYAGGK